ncbi:hypothetical protein M758_3G115700 [Ceratodon purpureus]|uniref:Uncharacterized protein n=1 Tax=Ceratodon purpureus TaxID=3225 RepID=A0A8T0IH97_CERPU|nr:hypothetical protein KC19_3G114500 [Ceratodon purpureus]KAG0622679.1 hypothetical protein M758_3G115700 [Ceratodon purpureus]
MLIPQASRTKADRGWTSPSLYKAFTGACLSRRLKNHTCAEIPLKTIIHDDNRSGCYQQASQLIKPVCQIVAIFSFVNSQMGRKVDNEEVKSQKPQFISP